MFRRLPFFLLILVFFTARVYATHNRAGYISYTWVSGYTYNFTITTYTNLAALSGGRGYPPDRCQLNIHFGDGDTAVANRSNNIIPGTCYPLGAGVDIVPGLTRYNTYTCSHTFNGPGSYWISMDDPNRNEFIDNIPNSVNTDFFIRSLLIINPALGAGHFNSPVLLNAPLDNGCLGQCFYYNPAAYS